MTISREKTTLHNIHSSNNGKRLKPRFDGAIASDQKVVGIKERFYAPLAHAFIFLKVDLREKSK